MKETQAEAPEKRIRELESENAKLRKSNDFRYVLLEELFDTVSKGVLFFDASGKLRAANKRIESFLGISRAALLNSDKPFAGFSCILTNNEPCPTDQLPPFVALRTGAETSMQLGMVAPGAPSPIWLQVKATPVGHPSGSELMGVVTTVMNVTEQKQTAEALRYNESLANTVINHSPMGISVRSATGQLLLYNENWRKLWEISDERLAKDLQPREALAFNERDDYLSTNQEGVKRVFTEGGTFTIPEIHTTGVRSKSGKRRWISQHFTGILDQQGKVERVVVLTMDITEHKEAELKLERYTKLLETLHVLDQAMLGLQSPYEISSVVLDHLKILIPYDAAVIMEWKPSVKHFEVLCEKSSFGIIKETGTIIQSDETRLSELLEKLNDNSPNGEMELFQFIEQLDPDLSGADIQSYILKPMYMKDELLGFISLISQTPQVFDASAHAQADEIAASLAIAIHQQRLFEQVKRDAETRSILLQEVNHRVKNNLASIIGFLTAKQLAAPHDDSGVYNSIMQDLQNRVKALLAAHDMLSDAQWSPLSISEIVRRMVDSVDSPVCRVELVQTGDQVLASSRQAHTLALIFNEIVMNIVKHAPDDCQAIRLHVSVSADSDTINIRFHDNGPGFPASVTDNGITGVGLSVVKTMVEKSLKGQIRFYNVHGAMVEMTFQRFSLLAT